MKQRKNKIKILLLISSFVIVNLGLIGPVKAESPIMKVLICKTSYQQTSTCEEANATSSLFGEKNIYPGYQADKWIKILNLTDKKQKVTLTAIQGDSFCPSKKSLADVLELKISQGSKILEEGKLAEFFSSEEKVLSSIPQKGENTYNISLLFSPTAGNEYQGCGVNFSLQIGFLGEEEKQNLNSNVGGGGYLYPQVFKVKDEKVEEVADSSAKISWITTKEANSIVIWASENENHSFDWLNKDNYGYSHSLTIDNKTKNHNINIESLSPGTTYYFRVISGDGRIKVASKEHSFKTLGIKISAPSPSPSTSVQQPTTSPQSSPLPKTPQPEKTGPTGPNSQVNHKGASANNINKENTEGNTEESNEEIPLITIEPTPTESISEKESNQGYFAWLAGSIGSLFNQKKSCLLIFLIIPLSLIYLVISIQKEKRPAKREQYIAYMVLTAAATIALMVVQYFYCPHWWLSLLLVSLIFNIFFIVKNWNINSRKDQGGQIIIPSTARQEKKF
ncbi:MAG TPA: hypothetical protein ENL27_01175 [Candidatus Parcubacteria bacterium]|nr:hypothetical protein [Candidatus Parcubacteria bacterium]